MRARLVGVPVRRRKPLSTSAKKRPCRSAARKPIAFGSRILRFRADTAALIARKTNSSSATSAAKRARALIENLQPTENLELAPQVGFEPTASRLTAECSNLFEIETSATEIVTMNNSRVLSHPRSCGTEPSAGPRFRM
jgi:hypothetical protein